MRRRTAVLAVSLLVLASAIVAACGGSDSHSSDASSTIEQTFSGNHPIRSGRVDATLDVDLQGLASLNQPLSLHLSGPFQSNGGKTLPDFALDLDVQSGTRPVTIGATFAQGGGWLTLEGQAFDLGNDITNAFRQGYEKAKSDSAQRSGSTDTLAALGIHPENWLRNPQTKGSEDIAGQQTQHVTAEVDVAKLLDDVSTLLGRAKSVASAGSTTAGTQVPTQLTPQQRDEIARSVKSATVDVWSGEDDHTLRRFALDLQLAVPQDVQAKAGGLKGGSVKLDVSFAQLNQPQKIAKPTGARPLSDLKTAIEQSGLLGSSGSGSGSSSSPGASSATPSTSSSDPQGQYAQCLAAAGEDLAKVQDCARLLK
jgi:hypothetical protein